MSRLKEQNTGDRREEFLTLAVQLQYDRYVSVKPIRESERKLSCIACKISKRAPIINALSWELGLR